jgi:hypothetical protein
MKWGMLNGNQDKKPERKTDVTKNTKQQQQKNPGEGRPHICNSCALICRNENTYLEFKKLECGFKSLSHEGREGCPQH